MPEELLVSIFDIRKLGVGTAIKVIPIEGQAHVGIVTAFNDTQIEVSSYDNEGFPTSCVIDTVQLLEEVVRIEVINLEDNAQ